MFGNFVPAKSLTLSLDLGLADGNSEVLGLRLLGHLKGNAVHQLVLQEDHCDTQESSVGTATRVNVKASRKH